jgi:hypothetical protein
VGQPALPTSRKDSADYQLMPEVDLDTNRDKLIEKEVYSSFNGELDLLLAVCRTQAVSVCLPLPSVKSYLHSGLLERKQLMRGRQAQPGEDRAGQWVRRADHHRRLHGRASPYRHLQ